MNRRSPLPAPRSRGKYLAFTAIAIILAAGVTGPRLYRMAQVRGLIDGATGSTETVTRMWEERVESWWPFSRSRYWMSWGDEDVQQPGNHRVRVGMYDWAGTAVGSQIEVVRLEEGGTPYLQYGRFTSPLRFVASIITLLVELGVAGLALMMWKATDPMSA